ncbi:hypothetical protein K491DRAFT_604234 [Lophiostoma macrostomum CBS 122681]|uniref:DUF7143 domain-containing protein n=1 Tax=Lophiostoma macrostomum CBS 122681 TaxID=1314788 RepID=A0A6A6T1M5_9PLEO|nr:hypothetical protein K491DRAFT_604234 [Lophiostoma macrostomum CBS 122681]
MYTLASEFGQAPRAHARQLKAHPRILSSRSLPCFLVGTEELPDEIEVELQALTESITCDFSITTIDQVPDVSTSTRSFSNINFQSSSTTPLRFALETFAIEHPVSTSDLRVFEERLALYLATEAGVRSQGGDTEIVLVRKFLELQIARIKKALGIDIDHSEQSPDYLLGEVLRHVGGEDLVLLGEVMALTSRMDY